ncbi:4-hydroxybenzoate transporter [Bradyrhizobium sp. CCBAU 11386]|uniref:MFS transporter n=1 Tax=Bradyrhizobium sp. CCBAU 11386 TaxID=1630837 RepID=UPI002302CB99|nr:MFS transporter [Bradyrhizobium sp. CCBAU 11386]MDA9508339.1 4-hydroxybenzoate transporter [Bradyrhizobium sp. CCBAU 11386]
MAQVINIGRFIDDRPVSAFQIRVICLCALVVGLDGFDAQALGFVAPALSKDLHLAPGALGPVFGASLFGVMIGSLLLGALADYFGRKWLVIAGVLLFALGSLATSQATSVSDLVMLRFVTGLGLGGVLPNTIALTGEYSPQRRRTLLIMLMFMTVSLGSAIGGSVAAKLITAYGWQVIFVIGGILPLILCPILIVWLPESLSLLALDERKSGSVRALLARIDPSVAFAADARFVIAEESGKGFLLPQLFTNRRLVPTLLLWVMFFMNMLDIYFLNSWLPTLTHGVGLDLQEAIAVGVAFQFGGILGTVGLGLLIERLGFHRVLFLTYVAGFASIVTIGLAGSMLPILVPAVFVAGVAVIGGQIGCNAYAARLYPTYIRATGLGWALGIGRFGSILGVTVGGLMLAAQWSIPSLFQVSAVPQLCSALVILGLAFLSMRRGRAPSSETQHDALSVPERAGA